MGRASGGGTCPLCGNYASFTTRGALYVHRGDVRVMIGRRIPEATA
ncbi:hypothetical protein ACH4F6_37590 [Streptomyces sp. NPDC017936]